MPLRRPKLGRLTVCLWTFDEDIALAKDAGMNEHLAKPVDIHKMFQVMSRLRGGQNR